MSESAIYQSGTPVRNKILPYGRQTIDDDDIRAVTEVLKADWLTTGPKVDEFEKAFVACAGVKHAVAVSNGTAALHCAMYAAGIGPGDEVIVPAMTFAATANSVVYCGGRPRFADVDPSTLLIDVNSIERLITPRTKAIAAVDYAGQPCDYEALRQITDKYGLRLIADACHALGGTYGEAPVGSLAELSTFSLHPVKPVTTGEGGVITTDDDELNRRLRLFRNHGITSDHRQRSVTGGYFYEMIDLGYNYRLTDIQCALGISQLQKLKAMTARRQQIAAAYDAAFENQGLVRPLGRVPGTTHAYHLYVIQLVLENLRANRDQFYLALRAEGIGTNVHYVPVHLHPYYRNNFGTGVGDCPVAEEAYRRILTLPVFPQMTNSDVEDVVEAIHKVARFFS